MRHSGTVHMSQEIQGGYRHTATGHQSGDRKNLPFFHAFLLLFAFLNATLRLNPESDLTAFRIALPFVAISIAIYNRDKIPSLLGCIFCILCMQLISLLISPYNFSFYNVAFLINYLVMIVFGFYVSTLNNVFSAKSIDKFITSYFYILIFALLVQFIFGVNFPNIPDADGALNGWYGNENNSSLALAAFIFYSARFGTLKKNIFGIFIAIVIMEYNGSRTCMLAIAILACYLVWRRYGVAVSLYLGIFLSAAFIMYLQYVVGEAGVLSDVLEFLDNLSVSIANILTGQVLDGVITSLNVRSSAAILAIMDFSNHPIFGIGSGNTITLITNNGEMFNDLIKSIHNMPLMMLVELGVLGFGVFVVCVVRLSSLKFRDLVFWAAIFLFASLSESGGFITNFFVLATFIIVIGRPEDDVRRRPGGRNSDVAYTY